MRVRNAKRHDARVEDGGVSTVNKGVVPRALAPMYAVANALNEPLDELTVPPVTGKLHNLTDCDVEPIWRLVRHLKRGSRSLKRPQATALASGRHGADYQFFTGFLSKSS